MSSVNSYVIWNNKGGVGKSTITFHVATRFAEQNPDKNVLVIDLCPQGNASMMLLGGGSTGEGQFINFCSRQNPPTVVGYLSAVISAGAGAPLPNPNTYATKINTYNSNLTDNLFLLCGDGNLEPMAPAITDAANSRPLTTASKPWVWVHNIFRDYIGNFAAKHSKKDLYVFIDTNPSFGIYTELAITAADRLIAPVNADDSSRTAANAMTILLHGTNPPHPIYGSWTFAAQATANGTNIPVIHLMVGNRLTQYSGAAKAFTSLSDETAKTLYRIYQTNPSYFTTPTGPIKSLRAFRNYYSAPLRDFNTAGVVSAHLGQRLSQMRSGYYPVFGNNVKVNTERLNECLDAIDIVISRL